MFTFDSQEESSRVFEIITEKDPFRLVIRGHALIEEVIDEAIDAAFPDGTPGELKGLRLAGRLALAQGLELITREIVAAVSALARIRNGYAHGGGGDEISDEESREMRAVVTPFIPDEVDMDDYSEGDQFRIAVAILWQTTQDTVHHALEQRQQAEAALAEYRGSQRTLTSEEVAALIEGDEDAWQGL